MKDIIVGILLTIAAIAIVSLIDAPPNWERAYQKELEKEQSSQQEQQISDECSSEIFIKGNLKENQSGSNNGYPQKNDNADIVLGDKIFVNTSLLSPHTGEG